MPPKKPDTTELVVTEVDRRIHIVRDTRVMLDFELAEMYGVTTAALNQAVDRNPERFPPDFSFVLEPHEIADLVTRSAISKPARGGRTKRSRVFTEQGVAMLSSVLRSETAVRVNIAIMRAFVRLRRLFATPGDLVTQLHQLAETVQIHDTQIKAIIDALQKMLAPPPESGSTRRIGFADPNTQPPTEEKK